MEPLAPGHPCGRGSAELTVALVSSRAMRRLNRAHTGRDEVTDVLAFDYGVETAPEEADSEPPGSCWSGEIVVCPGLAVDRAREFGHAPGRELAIYLVHGLLHLFGMDDRNPRECGEMRRAEARLVDLAAREIDLESVFRAPVRPGTPGESPA